MAKGKKKVPKVKKNQFAVVDVDDEVIIVGTEDDVKAKIMEDLNDGSKDIDDVEQWTVYEISGTRRIKAFLNHDVKLLK